MSHPHLSDEQLADICFTPYGEVPAAQAHLDVCDGCRRRQVAITSVVDDVGAWLAADADAVFTPERLARQRARILQQLDQDGRPARVIAFPGHVHEATPAPRTRRASRWAAVAAAVAASFVIGILAGRLAHDVPGARQQAAPVSAARPAAATVIRAALSDDEFLGQVELAAVRVSPAVLRPLDALTPSPWDGR